MVAVEGGNTEIFKALMNIRRLVKDKEGILGERVVNVDYVNPTVGDYRVYKRAQTFISTV